MNAFGHHAVKSYHKRDRILVFFQTVVLAKSNKSFSSRLVIKKQSTSPYKVSLALVDFTDAENISENEAVRQISVSIYESFRPGSSFSIIFCICWKRQVSTFLSISFVQCIKMHLYPSIAKKTSFAFFTNIHCVLKFLLERFRGRSTIWNKVNNVLPQKFDIIKINIFTRSRSINEDKESAMKKLYAVFSEQNKIW